MAIKVNLIAHTPNPEQTVAAAAKLCYSPVGVDEIQQGLTIEKTEAFVNMLSEIGHASPMEHASFTFAIEGISRACSHQLVRHRIASYSQQSQRYVDGNSFDFVTPPSIENCEEALEEYQSIISQQRTAYTKIRNALAATEIKKRNSSLCGTNDEIIEQYRAVDKADCSAIIKKANEDARFILPNACTTAIVVTMNTRALWNFFAHRCCNRAQWEIRQVAVQMLKLCKQAAPSLFKNAGPSCMSGKCPEGKMSCGKPKQMREYFLNLEK
ncbi:MULTISPECIES: FAD-dependent thymidylate synthase [unclassified Ruminococcus]|uniref:FAD-dependent thymidylate synthase n=1 Tax=unclassified Ruminococcus TaxID=2608920 RepID=UPI00210E8F4C|nr:MULTISPECIES: FAD-dependent thymidylate synthase [unclassified Ruminococcus]MCQ4023196.1 FAD-dependent thymidylate synthase [Ruminococcus sp. zg-924]MCQ4115414.1 FAD-dependent thymidylate synthase [Ruminococcus sp. zg-921]